MVTKLRQRLADLWNLDPYDSEVETMVSHLSRAIIMREVAEQESKECHQQLSETTPLQSGNFFSSPTVGKLFDDVKDFEEKCSNLPAVPEETDSYEDIESRLLNLKFFNQNYLNDAKTDDEISDEFNGRFEKIKNVAVNNAVKEN